MERRFSKDKCREVILQGIFEKSANAIILDELILSKFVKTIFIIYWVVKAGCRQEMNFIVILVIYFF